jgi:hypothetical protein
MIKVTGMKTTVRFENLQHGEITEQQASTLNEYYKVFSINCTVKYYEYFRDCQLTAVTYYKDTTETDEDILGGVPPNVTINIHEVSIIGNKQFKKSTTYDENHIIWEQNNALYDENNDCIGYERIDLTKGLPFYDETVKLYYDRQRYPENEIFEGKYKEDGTLDYIIYDRYSYQDSIWFSLDGNRGEDISALCGYAGLTEEQLAYYLTAVLVPDISPFIVTQLAFEI